MYRASFCLRPASRSASRDVQRIFRPQSQAAKNFHPLERYARRPFALCLLGSPLSEIKYLPPSPPIPSSNSTTATNTPHLQLPKVPVDCNCYCNLNASNSTLLLETGCAQSAILRTLSSATASFPPACSPLLVSTPQHVPNASHGR